MKTFVLISSLLFSTIVCCQIPNSGFENWSIVNSVEEPDNWETNNTPSPSYRSVTKTNDNYEGDYAMQLISRGFSIKGYGPGYARTVFTSEGVLNKISAFVKCDSISGAGHGLIRVYGYLNSTTQEIGYWETNVLIPQYTLVEIPLNPVANYDSLQIFISSSAQGWPFKLAGFARLKVDQLNAETVTGTKDLGVESMLEIFPNPAKDIFNISLPDFEVSPKKVMLFDLNGRKVQEFAVNTHPIQIDGSTLPQGVYTIKLLLESGTILTERVVIVR